MGPKLSGPNINGALDHFGATDLACPVIAAMVKFRILGPPHFGARGAISNSPPSGTPLLGTE